MSTTTTTDRDDIKITRLAPNDWLVEVGGERYAVGTHFGDCDLHNAAGMHLARIEGPGLRWSGTGVWPVVDHFGLDTYGDIIRAIYDTQLSQ